MAVWLLGDQLHPEHHVLDGADRVLMVEATGFADRRPYHPQKLGLLFAAMRHARDRLREAGYKVEYRRGDSFGDALDARPGDDRRGGLSVQRALLGLSGRPRGDAPGNGTDVADVQPRRPQGGRRVGRDPRA